MGERSRRTPFASGGCAGRSGAWPLHDDDAEIHHVGVGGAGLEQAAAAIEEVPGVAATQELVGVELQVAGPAGDFERCDGSRRIGGTIFTIGPSREEDGGGGGRVGCGEIFGREVPLDECRERQLLIATSQSAITGGGQPDHGFSAREEAEGGAVGSPAGLLFAGEAGEGLPDLGGFARVVRPEVEDVTACGGGGGGTGGERGLIAADEGVVEGGGGGGGGGLVDRFLLQPGEDVGGDGGGADSEAVEDGECRGGGARVGDGGAGGDDVERIAHDIGDDEGLGVTGADGAGEAASLDRRELFADGVEFVDGGTRLHEDAGDRLFVGERKAGGGGGQEGAATTREEDQAEVAGSEAGDAGEDFGGPGDTGGGRFVQPGGASGVEHDGGGEADAIGGDVHPARELARGKGGGEEIEGPADHASAGLAGADDLDAAQGGERIGAGADPECPGVDPQGVADELPGIDCRDPGVPDLPGQFLAVQAVHRDCSSMGVPLQVG